MVSSDKKTLYVFGGAIWPSAPWLAVTALGYDDQVNVEQVNLVEGANFAPEFVRKVRSVSQTLVFRAHRIVVS